LISLSEWESFCVPVAEAMFFGLPVIHTGTAPIPENVGNAETHIDKTDTSGAGRKISAVWDDTEAYGELRARALQRSEWFTDAALTKALEGVLRDWASAFDKNAAAPILAGGSRRPPCE
jgi:glycosyltransferase involved in cell wall biosynthesis